MKQPDSIRKNILSILFGSLVCYSLHANAKEQVYGMPMNSSDTSLPLYLQNREPLLQKPYLELPFGAIKPKGWLLDNLKKMSAGMTGRLDELYPAVMGKRNGWLGGDGDVWERGPYWLDGALPLAWILDDQKLKKKLLPWIEWSLTHQQEDGYFGPVPPEKDPAPEPGLQRDRARDWWPKMVMLKVLQQYFIATKDKRVIELMLKYARYQHKMLPQTPLGHYSWWGSQRGADNLLVIYWLYNVTGEKFLLDLAEIIHQQTYDWTNTFANTDKVTVPYSFHCVNFAQGIKSPVIYYQQNKNTRYVDATKKAFADMRTYMGQVQGMYGADELTRGGDPVLGSELCSTVEMMYSLENIITITGDPAMMDQLERIAFNALPTQISDDFMSRQYYQQANQVVVSRHRRNFVTNYDGTDQCFGLLTGFPCCTSNMHQGWPKFTQNLWYATRDKGAAALIYAPSEATIYVADGVPVTISEETGYPFEESIRFSISTRKPAAFPFHLRIPAWCTNAVIKINGAVYSQPPGGQVTKIERTWNNKDVVELVLPMEVKTSTWYEKSIGVERGPLVYALRIKENWTNVEGTDRYGNYREVHPGSDWNYGLMAPALKNLKDNFRVRQVKKVGDTPWNIDDAPILITTRGKKIPEWKLYNETAGPLPYSPQPYLQNEPEEELTLIPYGCTTLRISQFPVVQ